MLSRTKSLLKGTQSDDRNVKSLYEFRAPSYDTSWNPEFAKRIFTHLTDPPLSPGNRCLDLCCGPGLVTVLIAQQIVPGGRVYGIDVSEGLLHFAQADQNSQDYQLKNTNEINERHLKDLTNDERDCVRLIHHHVEDLFGLKELEGLEETFDLVSCADGLLFLRDPAKTVKSWGKWLKPGTGRMVLGVPHFMNLQSRLSLEAATSKLGIAIPFNRSWMKGERYLQDILEESEEFEVINMDFFEQFGGVNQHFGSSREIAEQHYMDLIDGETLSVWTRTLDASVKSKLKEEFCAAWISVANDQRVVTEVEGAWLAIAQRKT